MNNYVFVVVRGENNEGYQIDRIFKELSCAKEYVASQIKLLRQKQKDKLVYNNNELLWTFGCDYIQIYDEEVL